MAHSPSNPPAKKPTFDNTSIARGKTAYSQAIPLPKLNEVIAEVKRNRVLRIIDPATKMPPEQLDAFFAELTEKNNLLVLTGDKTQLASIEQAARKSFASQLKAKKLASPRWTTGDNKVDRMLGKELCVLAWARTAGSCVLEFWRARNCLNASTRAGSP